MQGKSQIYAKSLIQLEAPYGFDFKPKGVFSQWPSVPEIGVEIDIMLNVRWEQN